jgi:biopolymer transport protein ExbD
MNLRPRRSEPPRIDLTPLIDVVFLMLIFFMVSTTFDEQTRLKIDLPEASAEDESRPEASEAIKVTIDATGKFYVNDRQLVRHDRETLRRTLDDLSGGAADIPVVVSGDRSAPWQAMITLLDVAAQLGLNQLSFVAKRDVDDD